ncbi:MAG: TOBE domain-containing protein, partial [Solirubrobacteraceae bacterium]
DAALRAQTRAALQHARAAQGTTAVLVTHEQAEALSRGRAVGVLMAGRLVQTAAPTVLYRTPVTLGVARFVGEAVVVPGRAGGGTVSCPLGELPLLDGSVQGLVDVMIRPEQVQIHRPEAGASHRGVMGTVSALTFYGPDSVLQLRLDGLPEPISARVLGHAAPAPGERIELTINGEVMAYPRPGSSASPGESSERTALLTVPPSR